MKGAIEFSVKQIIVLILVLIIAAIVIFLSFKYSNEVKSSLSSLLHISEGFAG